MIYASNDGTLARAERLIKAHKLVLAILGMSAPQMDLLVARMSDKKGHLYIEWLDHDPTVFQKAAFGKAWEMCGEQPEAVGHLVIQSKV